MVASALPEPPQFAHIDIDNLDLLLELLLELELHLELPLADSTLAEADPKVKDSTLEASAVDNSSK